MHFFGKVNGNPWLIEIYKWGGILLISISVITSILIAPPSTEFTRQYYELGLEHIIFLILIFTLLLNLDGFWGEALSLIFTLSLFFLSLIYKWQAADSPAAVGGLFPLRDANTYYEGAQNIIYGLDITSYRPIFTSFLAVITKAVNSNLQITLIVLVTLSALAVYFAAREIKLTTNSNFASAIYLILCYMFFRRFSGTLLTENLGFCLGNLSLIFLIRGSTKNKLHLILYGLFLLTIGLNARAGAFFILPMLTIWAGFSFKGRYGFWRPFFLGIFVVVLGMTANLILAKLINSPDSKAFSNYSYTLYGIASGNKGWEQAGIDHPTASEAEIYALAFQKILAKPALFAQGVAGAYLDYFAASNGAFSFLLLTHGRNDLANSILWILSFTGLSLAMVKRKQKIYSISFAFFMGIILSVGLVPPADSQMMRVYAATIPVSCYIIITAVALSQNFLRKNIEIHPDSEWTGLRAPLLLSSMLLVACFVLPVLIKMTGQLPKIDLTIPCGFERKKITFVTANGSSMTLGSEKRGAYPPNLEIPGFIRIISNSQLTQEEKSLILNMQPGTTITIIRMALINSNNLITTANGYLITKKIPQQGVQTLCVDGPQLGMFYFAKPGDYKTKTPGFILNPQIQPAIQIVRTIGLWLIFIFILIKSAELNKFPACKILLVLINTTLIASGLLLLIHNTGIIPLAREQKILNSSQFEHRNNFLYAINIGGDLVSDTNLWDSPAYLYENGIPLSPPHEGQAIISEYGGGSYILKDEHLFFSTSDNSDPKVNGRQYMLQWPTRIRMRYQIAIFSAALMGLLFHVLYLKPSLKQNASP